MKLLAPLTHPNVAIAEGATTPVPSGGSGAVVYSTVLNKLVVWTGSLWSSNTSVGGGGGGSGNSFTTSATAPSNPVAGDEWFDLNSGINWTWVNDGDSSAWVETGAGGSGVDGVSGTNGTAATIAVGTVTTLASGSSATVVNVGNTTTAQLNFGIPRGADSTIAIGTTNTGAAGTNASVTNSGTSSAAILNFTVPKGDKGDAATVAVGTVSTGANGSNAIVTNSGTAAAAVFNFTLPAGPQGSATFTPFSNALGTAVTMTTAGTYYDGPSIASLAPGTYLVMGTVLVKSTSNAAMRVTVKLWDGTNVFYASEASVGAMGAGTPGYVAIPVNMMVTLGTTTTLKLSATSTLASCVMSVLPTDAVTGLTAANSASTHLIALKI